jgi:ribosomal protein L12E/L44/L45/RPP1/RPP2
MASVAADKLPQAERDQLAICYAAFVLEGSGAAVTADALKAVLQAASLTVDANLVNAVAKALKNKKVTEFFGGVGGGAAGPAPAAEKAAEKKADKPKEAAKVAPPPPPAAEEEEMDMGGLFD